MKRLNHRCQTYWLLAILGIAAVLRLNHIDQPYVDAFSWRQASTAMMADNYYRTNWNVFFPEVSWGGPGPNYQGREFQTVSYISALLYTILGQQDWIGRSVAAAFGIWGVFALYQLVRRVWDEERALCSAAVMAILPGSIFVDRSFLPDPAMVSLIVTSFWALVVHLQTGSRISLAITSLAFTWGALTKIPGLMVGLPMIYAIIAILNRREELCPRKLIPIGLMGTLSLIPVVIYYLWAKHLANTYPPYHFAGSAGWIWKQSLGLWLEEHYFLGELYVNAYWWMWTAPVMLLLLFGIVFPSFVRFPTQSPVGAPWTFHWWMLSAALYYAIGARQLVDNPWNFHIFAPAVAALAGQGIVVVTSFAGSIISWFVLRSRQWLANAKTAIFATIIAIFLTAILHTGHVKLKTLYSRPYGQESYELGLVLRESSQPGDLVVTMSSDLGDPNVIYYSRRRGWTFPPSDLDLDWSQLPEKDDDSIQMLEGLQERGADWFAIAGTQERKLWSEHPKLVNYIEANFVLHGRYGFGRIYRVPLR